VGGGDGGDRGFDEAEVGDVVFAERRGDADHDGVHIADLLEVGGGGEASFLRGLDVLGLDAPDVGLAGVELIDFGAVDVEAGDAEAFSGEEQGERETDVAEADDTDFGLSGLDFFR